MQHLIDLSWRTLIFFLSVFLYTSLLSSWSIVPLQLQAHILFLPNGFLRCYHTVEKVILVYFMKIKSYLVWGNFPINIHNATCTLLHKWLFSEIFMCCSCISSWALVKWKCPWNRGRHRCKEKNTFTLKWIDFICSCSSCIYKYYSIPCLQWLH